MLTNALKGARYALSGFKLIGRPRLRRFVLIPLLINCLLFSGALWAGSGWIDSLINNWLPGWLEWLRFIIWPLLALLALAVIFSTFTLIANLLGSPFNSMLAEAVATRLSDMPDQADQGQPTQQSINSAGLSNGLTKNALRAIRSELGKLLFFAVRALPLLILFMIPGLNFFAPFLWFLFGAWMMAHEYMDYPLANQQLAFSEQRLLLRKKRSLALGFGAAVMLMTLIPIVNFFAMPVAVAGATKMWFEQFNNS